MLERTQDTERLSGRNSRSRVAEGAEFKSVRCAGFVSTYFTFRPLVFGAAYRQLLRKRPERVLLFLLLLTLAVARLFRSPSATIAFCSARSLFAVADVFQMWRRQIARAALDSQKIRARRFPQEPLPSRAEVRHWRQQADLLSERAHGGPEANRAWSE